MFFMTFNVNSRIWARRAEVLTRSTTYATLCINRRNAMSVMLDHAYRPNRTMTCTVAARHAIGQHNAVVRNPDCMTNLYR